MSELLYLLSLLLRYPDEEVLGARAEIARAARVHPELRGFVDYWERTPDIELQRRYSETFDFRSRSCLYMTYFTCGDQRVRGGALARIKGIYARHGYHLQSAELPDHLPVMLEFASGVEQEGLALLAAHRKGLEVVRKSLRQESNPHASLLEAVVGLLPEMGEAELGELVALIREGPPSETVGLEPYGPEMPPPVSLQGGGR